MIKRQTCNRIHCLYYACSAKQFSGSTCYSKIRNVKMILRCKFERYSNSNCNSERILFTDLVLSILLCLYCYSTLSTIPYHHEFDEYCLGTTKTGLCIFDFPYPYINLVDIFKSARERYKKLVQ